MSMDRAMILIPPTADFDETIRQLIEYCEARDYAVVAIDRDGGPWWDTVMAARKTGIDVIVAAHPDHVPADRSPRLEIADLSAARPDLPDLPGPPADRRPRRL